MAAAEQRYGHAARILLELQPLDQRCRIRRLHALEADVHAAGGEVLELAPDLLTKITGKDNPQAVAGVFAEFDTGLASIDRSCAKIWLVAQALRDLL